MENNTNINPDLVPVSSKMGFGKAITIGLISGVVLATTVFFILSFVSVTPVINQIPVTEQLPAIDYDLAVAQARAKGEIDVVRSNLSNLRLHAELFYDANNEYLGVCQSDMFVSAISSIKYKAISGEVVCLDSVKAYVVAATLQDVDSTKTLCADSTGALTMPSEKASNFSSAKKYSCL